MTDKDPGLERLTNLTFAFLNAKDLGRQFLTSAWVRRHVDGYQGRDEESFEKAFQRDRAILTKVGVPIEAVAEGAIEAGKRVTGYRLQEEEYSLPAVSFTPEEATVLGLAGDRGMTGELAVFARSGWTKIAAGGASRELRQQGTFAVTGDITSLKGKTLDLLIGACAQGRSLAFTYTAHPGAEPVTRRLEPWGLVPLRGRMYLVGFDLDRQAARSFRITRVSDFDVTGTSTHSRPDTDLQQIVEDSLRIGKELVSATIRMPQGAVPELEALGERRGDVVELRDVDKHWLVRTCISNAPEALLIAPVALRDEVIAGLRQAVTDGTR